MSFGKRSEGQGGATGCTANVSRCAVVGCAEQARPQLCPADGSYHRHGAIHYEYCYSDLKFHDGDWYQVCDTHYLVIAAARRAWEVENDPRATDDNWSAGQ